MSVKILTSIFLFGSCLLLNSCGFISSSSRDEIISTSYTKQELRKRSDSTKTIIAFNESQGIVSIDLSRTILADSLFVRKDSIKTKIDNYLKDTETQFVYYFLLPMGALVLSAASGDEQPDGTHKWGTGSTIVAAAGSGSLIYLYTKLIDSESTYVTYRNNNTWTSKKEKMKLSNQSFKFTTPDYSNLDLQSDDNGRVEIPLSKICSNEYSSSEIGVLEVSRNDSGYWDNKERIVLQAPDNLSQYYVNLYTKNRQLALLETLLKKEFSPSIKSEIRSSYGQLLFDSLNSLISNRNFNAAINLYTHNSLYISEYDPLYEYSKIMQGSKWWEYYENKFNTLSNLFEEKTFKRETGNLYRISGKIIQVLDNAILVNSDNDNFTWYCSANNKTARTDLIDEIHIELYGVVMGTKSYTSVMGSSKTVPWIRILGLRTNQE